MSPEAIILAEQCGGLWREHEKYPLSDWQAMVANDDTRLGYWDWVVTQIEMETGINPVNLKEDIIDDPMQEDESEHSPSRGHDDF